MLIRSNWNLTVMTETVLPQTYSLDLIKRLHQQMNLPFEGDIPNVSFSGITGKYRSTQDFLTFYPGELYQLSLCGLQDVSAKAIATLTLGDRLEFLGALFAVGDRVDETTSYEALYQTWVADTPEPQRRFNLQFASPTAFAQDRVYLPLPVPTLMFRSWLERWNHFAPVYLGGDELIGYLAGAIALARHQLHTTPFRIHSGQVVGFKGEATLQILNRSDPLLANVAHLLIQYAEFAGTGIKTRLGMGTTVLKRSKLDLA
jgi:CRISPR-associated endoribonuclease Cas6